MGIAVFSGMVECRGGEVWKAWRGTGHSGFGSRILGVGFGLLSWYELGDDAEW